MNIWKKAWAGFCLLLLPVSVLAVDTDWDGIHDNKGNVVPLLDAGDYHSCVLDTVGLLHCWGSNWSGQTDIPLLNYPITVSAGGAHTCAIDDTGLHCWGYNNYGQIDVPALVNPRAVSAGNLHTCALDDAGVHCWGYGVFGQIDVPVLVNPVMISAGGYHTCALDSTGVHCWGDNNAGQTDVPALVNPVAVSAGFYHSCALDDNGVQCWGYDGYGQTAVPALMNPIAVSAGEPHSCAIDDMGVHCWGSNSNGQSRVPVLVNPLAVSAGVAHTCALDDTGVHCWGSNSGDQIDAPVMTFVADNCIFIANPDQLDSDNDGQGNACDDDDDNDGVADIYDALPLDETDWEDADGDNIGDMSDPLPEDGDTLNSIEGSIRQDKTGVAVAFAGDFDGDGFGDYVIGMPGYDRKTIMSTIKDAGRVEVISGRDGSVLASVNGLSAKDAMGFAVAGNGDYNGDGYADVLAGAPYADNELGFFPLREIEDFYSALAVDETPGRQILVDAGSVSILWGPHGKVSTAYYGQTAGDMAGMSLAFGDFNNDGYDEIILGVPNADDTVNNRVDAGRVSVLSGWSFEEIFSVYGYRAKAHAGMAVAAGNFNGVSGDEVVVGAPNDDDVANGLAHAGSVTIYDLGSSMPIVIYGSAAKDYFGKALAVSTQSNKHGVENVLIGIPGADDRVGKVKNVGGVCVLHGPTGSDCSILLGMDAKSRLGSVVAFGDVDGDGYADIISGAPKNDAPAVPKVTKDVGSLTLYSGNGFDFIDMLYGDNAKDYFGSSIATGDINADGKADLIIGIPGFDAPGDKPVKDAGAVKVISGNSL